MHDAVSYGLPWTVPFIGLLLTIAAAPIVLRHHWERHYWLFAIGWALAYLGPNAFAHGADGTVRQVLEVAIEEYLPFMLLLGTLFIVTGGISISGTLRGSAIANTGILAFGTMIASIVGTPGAALLLLRPLLRANLHRRKATHVFVFYIFLVANIGGSLSPLGDPPLFLGYLNGVPFFWPTLHLALPTLTLAGGMLATFYALDRYLQRRSDAQVLDAVVEAARLGIAGRINLVLLAAVIGVALLRVFWQTDSGIDVMGTHWTVVEIASNLLLAAIAVLSLALTPRGVRQANDFVWSPFIEVAVLFAAIFVTLLPVMQIVEAGPNGPAGALFAGMMAQGVPDNSMFYRVTGGLSAFLDNAPTYLVFFGLAGGDPARLIGPLAPTLVAISAGACYFGGFSYIGNAPNLMVKSIVERHGVPMPGFFGYIGWAAVYLLPWLLVIEVLFMH